jgi:selenocysteine-specific elongation factor
MVLATPDTFRKSRRIDVRLELLASARKMKQGARVHFHAGTAETIAEVFLYGEKVLAAGENTIANLKLQDEVLVMPGDRFIVRQFSPVVTIGGGLVLDPLARRPVARDAGRAAFLQTLERRNNAEILLAMTERALLGVSSREIVARTGWTGKEIHEAAGKLSGAKLVKMLSAEPLVLIAGKMFEEVRKRIVEKVGRFQKENPLSPGMAREDLRASLGRRVRAETFRAALEELTAERTLELRGELVKTAGSEIALQPEEAEAKAQIETVFASAGLAVPSAKEVLEKLVVEPGRARKLLQILLREKTLVQVTQELIFHRQALAQLKERLSGYKKTKGDRISVPVFKELAGITRKYAIPLLEYLDRERVTRRVGDERVIL